MPPEQIALVSTVIDAPSSSHESWRYCLRPLENGQWSVERGDGDVGGIFVTLHAAVRFMGSDLETMIFTQEKRAA